VKQTEATTERPPSRINGKPNPAYRKWWSATEAGKKYIKDWRQSESGKKSAKRYFKSAKGKAALCRAKVKRVSKVLKEKPESYADNIIRTLGSSINSIDDPYHGSQIDVGFDW